jgi:hypothetical protein
VISGSVSGIDKAFDGIMDDMINGLGIAVGDAVYDVATSLLERTPVDALEARDNWNIAIGQPDTSVSEGIGGEDGYYIDHSYLGRPKTGLYRSSNTPPPLASEPKPRPLTVIDYKQIKLQPVYVTNSNEYISDLDSGGHSKQAPSGIVDVAIQDYMSSPN